MTAKDLATDAQKLYIIIVGAVASGKTTLAMNLAKAFGSCFYFDKDDLCPLSAAAFVCGGRENDRHCDYFRQYVRDPEYDASERITLLGLRYADRVVYNAPYTGEIAVEAGGGESARLRDLYNAVHAAGGRLIFVFVESDRETVKAHLLRRREVNPEAYKRDVFIYDDLDGFVNTQNLRAPAPGAIRHADALFTFDSRRPREAFRALLRAFGLAGDIEYNVDIANR